MVFIGSSMKIRQLVEKSDKIS